MYLFIVKMNKSSIIFAIDSRKNIKWDLPFFRLGGKMSDSILNISYDNELSLYDEILSEGAKMQYIHKYFLEIGNPDYIGFCHYRRFFSLLKPNYGVFPIHYEKQYNQNLKQHILNSQQLLSIAINNNVDCIIPIKFPDYLYCKKCNNIIEILYNQSQYSKLGLQFDDCVKIFQILSNNIDGIDKTYSQLSTFHFNIFYMKSVFFNEMMNALYPIALKCISYIKTKHNDVELNSRWMGYILERFISCYIMLLQIKGCKILELPLLFIENMENINDQ